MKRRLLLIGYWYPDAGMGGVRLRRIARLLPRLGWEPVVLTHGTGSEPTQELPQGIRMVQASAPDLAAIYRSFRGSSRKPSSASSSAAPEPTAQQIGLTSNINRWVMVPDKQISWYRAAVRDLPGLANDDLLDFFLIEKAAYEVAYEVANRPAWLPIPLHGLSTLADRMLRPAPRRDT